MNYNEMPKQGEKMRDTPEDYRYKLGRMMEDIAEAANKEFGEDILNSDASINMRQWKRSAEFPEGYSKEDVKIDEEMVWRKKILYSGSSNLPEREAADNVAAWEKRRRLRKMDLLEPAAVGVFYKVLHKKFFVARPSIFDDYENGVDNIVINKETGDVVCAFDELWNDGVGERKMRDDEMNEKTRAEKKEEKIIRKAVKGGAKIKYGFGLADGKLVKKEITGVPMFCISVEANDFDRLLEGMDYLSVEPNAIELEIFDKLIMSLESQVELLHQKDVPIPVQKNILSFEKSLVEIKELRKNF